MNNALTDMAIRREVGQVDILSQTLYFTQVEFERTPHDMIRARIMSKVPTLRQMDMGELAAVFPRDWWEALKERWAPAWLKKRWPVRYRHIWVARRMYIEGLHLPKGANWFELIRYEESATPVMPFELGK